VSVEEAQRRESICRQVDNDSAFHHAQLPQIAFQKVGLEDAPVTADPDPQRLRTPGQFPQTENRTAVLGRLESGAYAMKELEGLLGMLRDRGAQFFQARQIAKETR